MTTPQTTGGSKVGKMDTLDWLENRDKMFGNTKEWAATLEGYKAYSGPNNMKSDAKQNPYHEGTPEYHAWWDGWYNADEIDAERSVR